MLSGVITKGIGGFYYVETEDGLYECRARGVFRIKGITPLPGDYVSISVIDTKARTGFIEETKERKNFLVRPAVANIDQIIIVIAIRSPQPDFELVDRLLVTSEMKNMESVVCVNKMDLGNAEDLNAITDIYKKAGYKVFATSCVDNTGIDKLYDVIKGKITVLAGQSGVGKSTLLNRIIEDNIMDTGTISEKIERGRHTTRHAQLVPLKTGGYIVDTPGFSAYNLEDIKANELQRYFPEFREFTYSCRFKGCNHIKEPDCGVKKAIEANLISPGRYERYCKFFEELKKQVEY